MRVAQVSPLFFDVSLDSDCGTSRVISYLVEGLLDQGHNVTLFASGDSNTGARLVAPPEAVRLEAHGSNSLARHFVLLEKVFQSAALFDFQTGYLHFPVAHRLAMPHLTTLYGRLDTPDLQMLYRNYQAMPVVSVSAAQRRPLAEANWRGTVYPGIPPTRHSNALEAEDYLVFVGRAFPMERCEIAGRSGMIMKIPAANDPHKRGTKYETVPP